MSEPSFDYPRILQRALRSVVREVLLRTAADGLPGDHHFYISLRTDHPGVQLPAFLRERYPEEITVVLQHQYWDLEVDEDGFAVTLRFDGEQARALGVPFEAVVAFFDPAAQFGLRFDLVGGWAAAPSRPTRSPRPAPTASRATNEGDAAARARGRTRPAASSTEERRRQRRQECSASTAPANARRKRRPPRD